MKTTFSVWLFYFTSLICISKAIIHSDLSGLQEKREEILSDRYKVEWQTNFDEETIEFNVTVKTRGYIGFGLSLQGGMPGADIIVGGVQDNGDIYFKDYYGVGLPNNIIEDKENNWNLVEASEDSNGVTFLRFNRKLDTCDPNNEDVAITEGTVKIIWSIGETDNIQYHTDRGVLAVNILDPPIPPVDLDQFTKTEFVKKVSVTPDKGTIYWCSMFKRMSQNESHIVAFKPKLDDPDALKHTHHFNVYTCTPPDGTDPVEFFDKFTVDHPGEDCFKNIPDGIPKTYCKNNLYAWSLGGRLLVFPEDIGFSWGLQEIEYFLFEVHLDNVGLDGPVTFETGVTIYDTEVLREKEAGMLAIGHLVGPSLLVPPNTKDWSIVGHCSSDCTQKHLEPEGIDLFNINLHSHLSGRKMKVRHFRNGTELPWISNDETYDSDFQENRPLIQSIKLLPGDHVSIECTYDSNWKEGDVAIGGYATSDEMCIIFAFYYPKSKLEACFSGYSNTKVYEQFGIESVKDAYEGSLDPIIVLPEKWAERTYSDILRKDIVWTNDFKTSLQNELLHKDHLDYCASKHTKALFHVAKSLLKTNNNEFEFPHVKYPEFDKEYEQPPSCSIDEETTHTTHTTSLRPTDTTPSIGAIINITPIGFLLAVFACVICIH